MCMGMGKLCAQSDDLGLWVSAEVKKKIFPGLDAFLEGEFRLRDNLRAVDRWGGTAGLSYRLFPFLKASAGYTYIYYNHPDTNWRSCIEHAVKIGLGTDQYELIEV